MVHYNSYYFFWQQPCIVHVVGLREKNETEIDVSQKL